MSTASLDSTSTEKVVQLDIQDLNAVDSIKEPVSPHPDLDYVIPNVDDHKKLLLAMRKACGWDSWSVPKWFVQQDEGKRFMTVFYLPGTTTPVGMGGIEYEDFEHQDKDVADPETKRGCVVSLFIYKQYRGQGYLGKILEILEEMSREKGLVTLTLYGLEKAPGYQKFGYKILKVADRNYGGDNNWKTTAYDYSTELPLAYTICSAIILVHLSRKRIRLSDHHKSVSIEDDLPEEISDDVENVHKPLHSQSNAGPVDLSIDLARLGLSALELGLSIFSIFLLHNNNSDSPEEQKQPREWWQFPDGLIQVVTWSFFLAQSFIRLLRPVIANQYWIRPQMDLFYILQWVLTSIHLYHLKGYTIYEPWTEWPLGLKLEASQWIVLSLLLWVSLITLPYQKPLTRAEMERQTRNPSTEYASSVYSQLTFAWLNPLVYLGYQRPLQDIDLPELENEDRSRVAATTFTTNGHKTFTRALLWELKGEFLVQFFWAVPWCAMVVAAPYCMYQILVYMQCKDCAPPTMDNYKWVFGLLFASFFQSLCSQQALHRGRRIYVHLASICTSQIYVKTLKRKDLSGPVDDDEKKGKNDDKSKKLNIANLVAVDLGGMIYTFSYLHQVYGYPVQFIFASLQLFWLLGYAALIGIGFLIVSLILPAMIYQVVLKLFKDTMNTKDERMERLHEMLSAIRIVKFFGWETKFVERIQATRTKELEQVRQTFIQSLYAGVIWTTMPLLNIVIVFVAYVKIFDHELSASTMFTTLALFQIMRQSLSSIPQNIPSVMHTIVSLERISTFLTEEDIVRDTVITKTADTKTGRHHVVGSPHAAAASLTFVSSPPTIGFIDATFNWPNKEDTAKGTTDTKGQFVPPTVSSDTDTAASTVAGEASKERFQLKNISLDFPLQQLSVIVGPTGSGKSALLLALLGELDRVRGSVYMPRLDNPENRLPGRGSGLAYASQTAWLQNATIQDNILFGKPMNKERYDAVVEGCALNPDFDIFEFGDRTEIGEQGITLSGGQKQRVALARAIYSDAHVLLLDDCLSAVDTHTGKHLFQTLTGPLLEERTIILVTHQVQLTMNAAEFVVVLNKGEVVGFGSPEEVVRNGWIDQVTLSLSPDQDSEVSTLDGEHGSVKKNMKTDTAAAANSVKAAPKLVEDEKKVEGTVAWRIYKIYIDATGGYKFWFGFLVLFFIGYGLEVGKDAWLAVWANKLAESTGTLVLTMANRALPTALSQSIQTAFSPIHDNQHYGLGTNETTSSFVSESHGSDPVNFARYLGNYILINILSMCFPIVGMFYTLRGNIRAGKRLHDRLLYKISRAQIRFFDKTPIGRIMNRFSADIKEIDEGVMEGLQAFLQYAIALVGIILVITVSSPAFIFAAILIVIVYAIIGVLYLPISRDLKRMNANSRSPILNHFNETLTGLVTIRAYGFEGHFQSKNLTNVDNNNRTFFLLWTTNRWLTWRVDFVGALVAFTTGLLVLRQWGEMEPGWAALSLTYSLQFTTTIVWLIRNHAENEMAMNSVERVAEYIDLEEEPAAIIEGSRSPPSWPHSGDIVIDELTMRYSHDTPEVLKNISLHIKAGEKVGIVGRTGSGKSTLAISLFRFMEPTHGSIRIDGIDIASIGLLDLRSNLTIIPQDAVLFKGTLRFNLDPFGERQDSELWTALRQSHLIPEVSDVSEHVAAVATAAEDTLATDSASATESSSESEA
ncbi:hypothetical protein BGZ83_008926, partial [Gryganskiella cystojenkinii]